MYRLLVISLSLLVSIGACAQGTELSITDQMDLAQRQKNQLSIFLIVTGVLLVVSIYLLIQSYRNKRKVTSMNRNLKAALVDKETLLKEVHHRVKNNLQMVSSLLELQARDIKDPELKQALQESQSRVHAMSIIHQKLYAGSDYNHVNIGDYVEEIIMSLSHSDLRSQDFFTLEGSNPSIHIEQAIPVGFIIHEMVTNSIKHAWKDADGKKEVYVRITVDGNIMSVHYHDNGDGLPDRFNIFKHESMGMRLINLFVHRQLGGNIKFWNDSGANFTFAFFMRDE